MNSKRGDGGYGRLPKFKLPATAAEGGEEKKKEKEGEEEKRKRGRKEEGVSRPAAKVFALLKVARRRRR